MADIVREEEFDEEMERREFRRKRRFRNQLIAYISSAVILAGIIGGAAFGIHKAFSVLNDRRHAQELQDQLQELADTESEPVTVEAPESTSLEEEKSQLDEIVDNCIAEMTLEDKVAGLFIVSPDALTGANPAIVAGDTTRDRLNQYAVGGLIYFAQNIRDENQLKEMIAGTNSYTKYPLFIAVDEEGGTVSRVAESGLADNVGSMAEIGATGDVAQAAEAGSNIAAYLSEFGFNLDFAPVADVILDESAVIGDRSFGSNAGEVGTMVAAVVEGLQGGGVSACLKHFPGLGSSTEDTHDAMVVSEQTQEDFESNEFLSFQAGIDTGVDMVMVSHLSVPSIVGDNTPSSLSGKMITEILRGQLGYEGIVITDALNMGAITEYYSSGDAAVKAIQAGADMLLMPDDFEEAYEALLQAVNSGTISEERINESLRRIYRVKRRNEVQ